ncbi:UNVERIFIED_CONTAM: hypothetical protein FKN15_057688 [Acipenser sinensis]
MSGFNFGASSGGFNFGTPKTTAGSTAGFSLTGASTTGNTGGGFSFGTPSQPQAAAQPSSLFSMATPASSGTQTGFSFGAQATSTLAAAAAPVQTTGGGFSFGASAPKINLAMPNPTQALTSAGLTLVGSTAAPTATSSAAASAGGGLGFMQKPLGVTTAASTALSGAVTGFSLGMKPAGLGAIGTTAPPATTTITATAASTASAPPVMTYAQLENLINKWSLELEDQERHFLQQATQVNAWDRMLIENGEKITSLHREVEKVKLDQRRLDQEMDFILSQQKELEDLLTPLEESVKEQNGTIYMQNADEEREKTYKLAENIDAQLKRMSQDLKEIIEHVNTSSSSSETSDPVSGGFNLLQICKILNAHMDSLQWIDQNSVLLQRRVEEVSKLCEGRRKEQEKNFRIAFD